MNAFPEPTDSDDFFADSRMSLGDHLEELRRRLWRALAGFGVGLVVGFCVSPYLLEWIAAPLDAELLRLYERRAAAVADRLARGELAKENQPCEVAAEVRIAEVARELGLPAPGPDRPEWVMLTLRVRPVSWMIVLDPGQRVLRPPVGSTLTITEPFTVYFKVSAYAGIVLASPWVFYQLWAFVAAGLYPHERRLVRVYLPVSVGLFLAGVALCEVAVLPWGVRYLLSFNEWLNMEPAVRFSEWLYFATLMPLVFGCAFQTPLVMLFLDRIGIAGADTYRRHRRLALFGLALVAALLAVAPDWYSMVALMLPMWGLYELGIVLCRLSPRPAPWPEEGADELAEVEV
jgi:sec-independent protein translocase protein TatC